ncbi:MAG: hypothetical protein P1V97_14590 [Planctomycetota bacterium]|nr:hypothetical protein [Planctomycetota bacterium]
MIQSPRLWHNELIESGSHFLRELRSVIALADPQSLVKAKPKFLCCALGLLGQVTYDALGGTERRDEVGRAGAQLSILTKIDDQVIDDLTFHKGSALSFEEAREKTKDYLAPTLQSIKTGIPANEEGRSVLGARLGQELKVLAGGQHSRLNQVIDWIEDGWTIQTQAVATLSRHSAELSLEAVEKVTRDISGAWLLMISALGSLPQDAGRSLTAAEREGFYNFGWHIQRADALADMAKDLTDGLISSYPDRLLYSIDNGQYERCIQEQDPKFIYQVCQAREIDKMCMPRAGELTQCAEQLSALGALPDLLNWIHGFLTWRYIVHPQSRRSEDSVEFKEYFARSRQYRSYVAQVSQLELNRLDSIVVGQ